MSEQLTHQAIAVYLNHALPLDAWHAALDSSGKASFVVAAKLKARGGKRGTPDHCILWNGTSIWLEIKTETGRVADAQHDVHAAIRRAGSAVHVVRSIEDTEAALRSHGMPLRAMTGMSVEERDARLEARARGPRKATRKRAEKGSQSDIRRTNALRARLPF